MGKKYFGHCENCGFKGKAKRSGSVSGGFLSFCPRCGYHTTWDPEKGSADYGR